MGYTYWILRYVPDVTRGERVNVGVVVGGTDASTADWSIRRVHSFTRANRIGGDAREIDDVLRFIESVISPSPSDYNFFAELRTSPVTLPTASWMERLRGQQQNNLQISSPRPVSGSDAAKLADFLFNMLVMELPRRKATARDRQVLVRDLADVFYEHVPMRQVRRSVQLHAGAQRTSIDFAIGRDNVRMLSHVVTFDVAQPQALSDRLQANAYTLHRLRTEGGDVRSTRKSTLRNAFSVANDVPLRFLFVPPETPQQREVYESARDAWDELGIEARPVGQEKALATDARLALSGADLDPDDRWSRTLGRIELQTLNRAGLGGPAGSLPSPSRE